MIGTRAVNRPPPAVCAARGDVAILRAEMAHDTHAAADAHHAGEDHPELPPVQDEAADTPMWLPATGLALLALLTLLVLFRATHHETEIPPAAGAERVLEAAAEE